MTMTVLLIKSIKLEKFSRYDFFQVQSRNELLINRNIVHPFCKVLNLNRRENIVYARNLQNNNDLVFSI